MANRVAGFSRFRFSFVRMPYSPDYLLQRLAVLQTAGGLFASTRVNPAWAYRRTDTNVFFTAITIFTLQTLRPRLSADAQERVARMSYQAIAAYERFRNKDGLKTYNFYQTNPTQHFPQGYVFRHFRHFQLPDDIDDTAMVYLTTEPAPADLAWLKQKLPQHANGTDQIAQTTFPDYRSLRVYSTWFGKTMPIELDACALSNLLYCIYQYKLPRNQHDADSLTFLRSIVETDRYRTDPFRCAHNYARTSLILYHLVRFIAAFDPPELRSIRAKLVADALAEMERVTNRMDKILLATSLLRLGEQPPELALDGIEADFPAFHFFIAGLLSAYGQPWVYRWANCRFWQIRWQCEAYNWALVLEYVMLRNW